MPEIKKILKPICLCEESDSLDKVSKIIGKNGNKMIFVKQEDKIIGYLSSHQLLSLFAAKIDLKREVASTHLSKIDLDVNTNSSLAAAIDSLLIQKIDCIPMLDFDAQPLGVLYLNELLDVQKQEIKHGKVNGLQEIEMHKILKEKEDYIAMICHDIRTPLSVVVNCCDYIKLVDEKAKILTDEYKDFFARITRNTYRAIDFVANLLDLGKLEAEKEVLNIESTNAAEYLSAISEDMSTISKTKGIKINNEFEVSQKILVDRRRFRQVIENLIVNAIKFSPKDREIFLSAKEVRRGGSECVKISVRDQGPGIPEHYISSIFKKYEQIPGSVELKNGFGLGLSIAFRLIMLHGAAFEVDGGHGRGAEFSIILPERLLEKIQQNDKSSFILVVEDDEDILNHLCALLKDNDLNPVKAKNGAEALDILQKQVPDLVISDIKMPDIDGIELLEHVKRNMPQVPCILVSGAFPNLNEENGRAAFKADKLVLKPFESHDIINAVIDCLPPKGS